MFISNNLHPANPLAEKAEKLYKFEEVNKEDIFK